MIPYNIDWKRIANFTNRYGRLGYHYIETPWVVSQRATLSTFEHPVTLTDGNVPVGSAEQGFVQLMLDGRIDRGTNYVSAGPCFRPADAALPDHSPWFFKVELIHIAPEGQTASEEMVLACLENARRILDYEATMYQALNGLDEVHVVAEKTAEGWDLLLNGLEIGSYGVRSYEGWSWAYGTGLAEPRYTLALVRGF